MTTLPFRRFGVMLDMSRNAVMDLPALKEFAREIADMGYNTLLLYTEDTYCLPEEPYFGHGRGRYSQEDVREIVAFCEGLGLEVIPCIQTLAHLDAYLKWRHTAPITDTANILLAGSDRVYTLIRQMLRSIKASYKSPLVHIGMDEAHMLGLGKYLDQNGYQSRFEILSKHLKRVCEIAKEEGLEPNIWSDMFFRLGNSGVYSSDHPRLDPEEIGELPEGLALTYWDYYSTKKARYRAMFRAHKKLGGNLWFAGGIWTWKGFAPDNRHSVATCLAGLAVAAEEGVENAFVTLWGDNGGECSRFAALPALFVCAETVRGERDRSRIRRKFKERYGISYESFLNLDLKITQKTVANPEKYLLYNDPFLGLLDSTLSGGESERYARFARCLSRHGKHPRFGLLFRSQAALAKTLSHKAELGARTRAAYQSGDKKAAAALLAEYDRAIRSLERFAELFCALWLSENRPQGLEVQETRLGGALFRLKSCRRRWALWIETDQPIPELEEKALDYFGDGEEMRRQHFRHTAYLKMYTAGRE
ncbi:MAG: beta-N-acetylhexosaminidase [Clostridia bacterium]|nr:beta-N-acetylhexosaminidase [Clostridia bacterium]